MDKNQNQLEKLISENLNQDLLDIKDDKSNAVNNEINNIIIIKELINSLKEKINIYEKQIKKLIDDKVKLQMDMNSIILQNLSLKKKNNSIQKIENSKEEEIIDINKLNLALSSNDINNNNQEQIILSTIININKKLLEQNKELKAQIDIFKSNIDIYKQKIIELKENSLKKDFKCKFCEEKKLEISKMASEKEEIFNSIKSLRKQLDELKLNEKIKREKKRKQRIGKNESLPNIEQYFIVNNKFQLVDSNKNLWHMKKCMRFQDFKNKYEQANLSPDDLLKEFVETYEVKIDDENNEENEFMESFRSSENDRENERKKYMPPLPGMGGSFNKKKNENNKNNDIINNKDDIELNSDNNINNKNEKEINNEDIQININENEENNKDKETQEIKNEEKKSENNDNNINNPNEIKEETSFNLSDNTD